MMVTSGVATERTANDSQLHFPIRCAATWLLPSREFVCERYLCLP